MNFKWKGVFPAVTTKFTENDHLDLDMFTHNINAQIDAGVDGIVLGGTLGEASSLQAEEKQVLTRKSVEIAAGRVPVILNIAEQTTQGAIDAVKAAENAGANGLMILPPMRYKASDDETLVYYKTVADSTDLPIMVYNNPVDYRIKVTLDMFEQLALCKNIQAVKESTRDVSNVTRMINRFGDRFQILCGVDTLALESLFMGAHGWVAGLVCAFPRETVAIYRLAKAGRHQEALQIYRWFLPLLELDIHPKLVQYIKLAEQMTGLGTEMVRAPRLALTGEERACVQSIVQQGMDNRPALPNYLELETA